ncbi:MAG: hypothetical protein Q9198_008863 [Flavoplaca austrocitrina]
MDIHRKVPPEPVSECSSTSANPPEPVSKERSPSIEAPETVHKHSNKGTIPSASTSTSSKAQTQTSSRPNTLSQTQTLLTHHNTGSQSQQICTPSEPSTKTKRKPGSAVKAGSEDGKMEDEAGLSEEGEEEGMDDGKGGRPRTMRRKGGGE